ncbi:uncharacterized protein [Apostichopus japonicus]|uniref:uncharacterized protein isoform X3 n=1 Tax=Stichopus japonicus TaxID=307972 RepID=UPI003AB4BEF5
MIWGMVLKPGEDWTIEAHSEEHLTLASLDCRPGQSNEEDNPCSYLLLKMPSRDHLICTLQKGLVQQQNLDMVIQSGSEVTFTVEGTGTVYLTGYNKKTEQEKGLNSSSETESSERKEDAETDTDGAKRSRGVVNGEDAKSAETTDGNDSQKESGRTNLRFTTRVVKDSASQSKGDSNAFQQGDKENMPERAAKQTKDSRKRKQEEDRNSQKDLHRRKKKVKSETEFCCPECSKTYKSKRSLKLHLSKKHKPSMDDRGDDTNQDSSSHGNTGMEKRDRKTEESPDRRYECPDCKKIFGSLLGLNKHRQSHEELDCSICMQEFPTQEAMTLHKRQSHGIVKRFSCHACQNRYWTKHELDMHMQHHTADIPIDCPLCNQTFRDYVELKKHMKTHAGEFPFKCKFCHEQCNDSHDLHEHQQTHILELERPFQCAFCESNYKYKHDVKHHEIKHVGGESFHCQFCGKGFYKKSVRGAHERKHRARMQKSS